MKIENLNPKPSCRENFRRDRRIFVPEMSGCYALATFEEDILYIGLAKNLRRRLIDHLNDPRKISKTSNGRAFFFYWLECDELEKIERTWQNSCVLSDGRLPVLNKIVSPVSA